MTKTFLTTNEINLCNAGYGYTVNNGYGALTTAADVMKVLEACLLRSKREIAIGKIGGFECSEQQARLSNLDLQFKALAGRVAA